jgi:hypothetical protein
MADEPDLPFLEKRLGLPLGPTLTELVRLCFRTAPADPAGAFWRLHLYLDWIHPGSTETADAALRIPRMTPAEVMPFGASATDLQHYGFLMRDPALPTEQRPIVYVSKGAPAEVIAADLRSFLGLVAYAGAADMRRHFSDPDWAARRTAMLDPHRGGGASAQKLSELLLSVPGVSLPSSPSAVVQASPNLQVS